MVLMVISSAVLAAIIDGINAPKNMEQIKVEDTVRDFIIVKCELISKRWKFFERTYIYTHRSSYVLLKFHSGKTVPRYLIRLQSWKYPKNMVKTCIIPWQIGGIHFFHCSTNKHRQRPKWRMNHHWWKTHWYWWLNGTNLEVVLFSGLTRWISRK